MRPYAWRYIAEAHLRHQFGYAPDGRDPFVLLFPQYKIAYVPVPKAANSSIRSALLPLLGVDPDDAPRIQAFDGFEERRLSQCLDRLGSDWFVFSVVRDPYARAASAFLDKVARRDPVLRAFKRMGLQKGDTFIDYLTVVSRWPRSSLNDHILPQSELLFRPQAMPGSRIFKVEDLGEAWPMVCDEVETRSGIRLPPIGRRNVGKSGIPWVSIYDDRSRRMVERIYSRDFETFGYAYSQAPGR